MTPTSPDPYLHARYDALHDSPTQRRFRKLCPVPLGVVFLPWAGMTEEDMRQHFRLMRKLGFRNLKQTMPSPQWSRQRILEVALDEGIIPTRFGDGAYAGDLDELCAELGISADLSLHEKLRHPKMWAHQKAVFARRVTWDGNEVTGAEGTVLEDAGYQAFDRTKGLRLYPDPILRSDAEPFFKQWAEEQYGTIEALNAAWNNEEVGIQEVPYTSWEDFHADTGLKRHNQREYRYLRDILRFKADTFVARLRTDLEAARQRDPEEPQSGGCEMGIFLPFAWRGCDMEANAEVLRDYGTFSPSIHLAWHFEEIHFEVARAVYMQASLTVDWFKGGWNAAWETTGGPQQFSGAKGWDRRAQESTPGYQVHEGTMSQLICSYLAAGYRGAGFWTWNFRRAGWEGGEYALLDRQGHPSPRALRVGQFAQAADRLREEIWQLRKEPLVGVFWNWDSDAIWAAISVTGRDHFKNYPVHARIGAARALINGNIPWEHVTANDVRDGLAPRYRTIYLPAQVAIDEPLLERLAGYVEAGGRLVLDAPGAWYNENGRVLDTGADSLFGRLFGIALTDMQYSNNGPRSVEGEPLDDFLYDLAPSTAAVTTPFADGKPAITTNRYGKGTAVLLAFAASHACFRPGREKLEAIIQREALGDQRSPYTCTGAIVYRQIGPAADHYFFINDGPATQVHLTVHDQTYATVEDPLTGDTLTPRALIALEADSARWLRFVK